MPKFLFLHKLVRGKQTHVKDFYLVFGAQKLPSLVYA